MEMYFNHFNDDFTFQLQTTMGKTSNLTPKKRESIIRMRSDGEKESRIAKQLNCHQSTVSRTIKRWNEEQSLSERVRSGRPRKTTLRMDRLITRMSKCDRFRTSTDIAATLSQVHNVQLSKRTIRRRLCHAGLFGRSAQKKPFINLTNRRKRLQWAKDHRHWTFADWSKVLFSDESQFVRVHSTGRVYIRRSLSETYSTLCTRPTVQSGGDSAMIWGCFSASGVGPIRHIEGRMNAESYSHIITNIVDQQMEEVIPITGYYQHDNAPIHTARRIQQLMNSLHITVLPWSAQSPDLMKKCWRHFQEK